MRALLLTFTILLAAACVSSGPVVAPDATGAGGARLAPPVGSWRLVGFAGADADAAVGPEVTLVVQEDGKVAGNGGCNAFFGMWTLGPAQDTLGAIGSTRRQCQPEVMEIEGRYFQALSQVGGWLPTDDGILLTDAEGDPLLRLRRQ